VEDACALLMLEALEEVLLFDEDEDEEEEDEDEEDEEDD